MAMLSGLLYKSISFFIASKSEKCTLNSDNKFSILEAKVENSDPPQSFSSSARSLHDGKWDKTLFFKHVLKRLSLLQNHSQSQTNLVQFDP